MQNRYKEMPSSKDTQANGRKSKTTKVRPKISPKKQGKTDIIRCKAAKMPKRMPKRIKTTTKIRKYAKHSQNDDK